MINNLNIDMTTKPVGFWKMLWIRIVGKREVTINMGFKIISYYYKGCAYVTYMKGVN